MGVCWVGCGENGCCDDTDTSETERAVSGLPTSSSWLCPNMLRNDSFACLTISVSSRTIVLTIGSSSAPNSVSNRLRCSRRAASMRLDRHTSANFSFNGASDRTTVESNPVPRLPSRSAPNPGSSMRIYSVPLSTSPVIGNSPSVSRSLARLYTGLRVGSSGIVTTGLYVDWSVFGSISNWTPGEAEDSNITPRLQLSFCRYVDKA